MRTVNSSFGRLGAILLSLALCLVMLPGAAFAAETDADDYVDDEVSSVASVAEVSEDVDEDVDEDEDENENTDATDTGTDDTPANKELTVGSGETYTTIQGAIDYINEQENKDGWTITVEKGTYTYFTVNQYISNLTITAETDATVTVDCSSGSIQLCGDTITLEGLTFTAEDTAWSVPVIKDASSNAGLYYDSMVTIKDCAFEGTNAGCALWICRLNSTVQDCTFDGFSYAIEIINETSTAAKIDTETTTGTITIDGNTVTNCDFFIHYGVRSGITLVVTDNVVTGSKDEVCASLFAWDGESITVTGNIFTYAAFGLQNAVNGVTAKDFLNTNIFNYSYTADDYYNYSTGKDYSVTYYAPEFSGKTPVWSVSKTGVTGIMAEYFTAALKGRENDNPLTFTTTDGEGDLVCMGLGYQALNLDYEETYPGLEKTIVLENGTKVDQDDVAAGDTVTFQLTSNVPSNLTDYIDYTYSTTGSTSGIVGTVKDEATYTLTFHDVMDEKLAFQNDITVTLVDSEGNETVLTNTEEVTYYTVTTSTTDGCTFEVSMDLLALYTVHIIDENDFGTTSITVTYTADLSEEAAAGTYKNTAWVSYPDDEEGKEDESEKDTVEVDTYGLSIFKYDQAPVYNEDGSEEDPTGLSGAVFTLYSDEDCTKVVDTLTSDGEGYATLNGLDAGTYYLKETTAPNGYVMSNVTVKVVLPDDADENTNVVSVNFANSAIPSTGGMGTTMYTVVGVCIVLTAGLALVATRKIRRAE
ncbi:MAG: isopeptide-forming domain-containing fimbrial protein [Clostridiales bacterium]|nr:isopeptide-forming domain-containing fimbrial protein [Clostridiales bacterium]